MPNFPKSRLPRILLLVGSLAGCWVLFFLVHVRGYGFGLASLDFFRLGSQSKHVDNTVVNTTPPPVTTTPPPDAPNVVNPITPRILLVSAVYPVSQAKLQSQSPSEYRTWLKNYLGGVTTDMYIYTTPELEADIRSMHPSSSRFKGGEGGNIPRLTINTTYASPLLTLPLRNWDAAYTRMRKKDRAKSKHTPELYAFGNSRVYWVDRAVKEANKRVEEGSNAGEKAYDYAFWCDVGSFKIDIALGHGKEKGKWPDPARIDAVWEEGAQAARGRKKEELLFMPVWAPPHPSMAMWNENLGPIDNKFTEGAFFGGPPTAIDWFTRTFYAYHDHYISFSTFVGKEQALINALVVLFKDRVIAVWAGDEEAPAHKELLQATSEAGLTSKTGQPSGKPEKENNPLGKCNSEYFYYQFFLAHPRTQRLLGTTWLRKSEAWFSVSRIFSWLWASEDDEEVRLRPELEARRCRVTRVVWMEDVLKRQFGEGWGGVGGSVVVPERLVWD